MTVTVRNQIEDIETLKIDTFETKIDQSEIDKNEIIEIKKDKNETVEVDGAQIDENENFSEAEIMIPDLLTESPPSVNNLPKSDDLSTASVRLNFKSTEAPISTKMIDDSQGYDIDQIELDRFEPIEIIENNNREKIDILPTSTTSTTVTPKKTTTKTKNITTKTTTEVEPSTIESNTEPTTKFTTTQRQTILLKDILQEPTKGQRMAIVAETEKTDEIENLETAGNDKFSSLIVGLAVLLICLLGKSLTINFIYSLHRSWYVN